MTDHRSTEPICTAVIEAVAKEEGVDPIQITEPLGKVINPDALNTICRNSRVRIAFEYHNYLVTIDSENTVTLTDAYRH